MDPQIDAITQAPENNPKEKSGRASRASVASILALVGARLGVEVTVVYNIAKDFLTGKHRNTASGANRDFNPLKLLFSAFNQKSTYVAAAAGAVVLGAFGWARGERIQHPGDLLIHPFKSLKLIFGKDPQNNANADAAISSSGDKGSDGADASPQVASAIGPEEQKKNVAFRTVRGAAIGSVIMTPVALMRRPLSVKVGATDVLSGGAIGGLIGYIRASRENRKLAEKNSATARLEAERAETATAPTPSR